MKTSLATTLSVIGVLATGGVAMAVNTTVLDSTVSSIEGPSPLAEALVPVAALSVDSAIPIAPLSPVASTSVRSAYEVQGVGLITLEQNGSGLGVVEVNPVSGWTYESTNELGTRTEIRFINGEQDVKFTAELLDGRVVTAVEATNTSSTSSPNSNDGGGGEDENKDEGEGNDD